MQQRCGAAESLCSETLMSAAVRQQLIVMLISKLLPPSLHSFSSSFVLSLSLSPPSLSSSPLHSAVISVSPPSGFLSHPPSVSPSITSPLLFLCLLSPSFSRSLLLSVLSDVTLPSIPSSLSSLFFIFLFSHLLIDKRSSEASLKPCVSSSGHTQCVNMCVSAGACVYKPCILARLLILCCVTNHLPTSSEAIWRREKKGNERCEERREDG